MKICQTFKRLMPTTDSGEIIKVTTYYSSFDKFEVDRLQEILREEIGSGIIGEFEFKEEEE